jgi:hypothetical protein
VLLSWNFRDQHRQFTAKIASVLAILTASIPASAEPLKDPATGLAVNPPPGSVAKPRAGSGHYTVEFEVKKPDDKDTGCRVGFLHNQANAAFTQQELNAHAATPEWANEIRRVFSQALEIISLEPFEHASVLGSVIVVDRKMLPGTPPRAAEIRSWLIVLETPKGRTNMDCNAEKTSFDARRSEFEAVARGITPPR